MSEEPKIHGLDAMYFDRRRSLGSAMKWSGVVAEPRFIVDVGANIGQTLESFKLVAERKLLVVRAIA